MAYLARELITNAYDLSGIVGRGYETAGGQQESDGLFLLNSFLAIKSANVSYIPYYRAETVTAIVGVEKYFIEDLVIAEVFTFFINSVRYQTNGVGRDRYFGYARANGIKSLPLEWHYERTLNGSDLYLYFTPDAAYEMEIWGKFSLPSNITIGQDLSLIFDKYYLEYLRFGLAEYICANNGITFSPQAYQKLKEYEAFLSNISPPDFTIQTQKAFGPGANLMYADANIGKGYRP